MRLAAHQAIALCLLLGLTTAASGQSDVRRPSEIPLAPESAAEVALSRSPALKAARARARAEQSDAQADSRPEEPRLSGYYEAGHGDGQSRVEMTFDLWSLIGAGARRRAAEEAGAEAEADFAEEALALVEDAKSAVYDVQAASATLILRRERADAARGLKDKAAAGLAGIQAVRAEAALEAARSELSRLLRAPTNSGWWTEARLPEPPADVPDAASLLSLAVTRRPSRAAAVAAARAAEQRSRAWSSASAGEMRMGHSAEHQPDGRRYGGAAFDVDLPVFNASRPGLEAARARADEAAEKADEEEAALTAELETLRARLIAARDEEKLWRESVVPARGDADARAAWIEALRSYWTTRAALERAVGGSLPSGESR
ncbi:MAG TPA: TolC family protein [Elusimicrobiota bacterium]|nr:TolC family protein [Elusimicrobiota bacterium]